MNKSFLLLGLASVMSAFTGCTTDETDNITIPEPQSTSPQTLVAQFQDEGSTRVEMAPNGRTVRWSAGDAIAVYSADNATKKIRYMLKSGFEGQGVGEFQLVPDQTGNITLASYGEYDGLEEKTYVAVYPSTQFYQKQFMTTSPLELGATIPAKQKYVEGSFDPKALPMMAVFNTDTPDQNPPSLKFKYMGSLIRLPLVAPTATTLESVKVETGTYGRIAGTTYYQFYRSMYYNDKEGRDACFTDMSRPMDYQKEGRYTGTQSNVTLMGPIPVSSTPTDLLFGVLPYDYRKQTGGGSNARKFTFTFQYEDGSSVEKSTQNGSEMRPGNIAVMPTFTLDVPYMPVATISGNELSWTSNPTISNSYEIIILDLDYNEPLMTIPLKTEATSLDIVKDIWPELDALVGTTFQAGEEWQLGLQVRAIYHSNTQYADAVSSVPVAAPTYIVPTPEIKAEFFHDSKATSDYIKVENYTAFSKMEWAGPVILAHEKPATEADFANATFTKATSYIIQGIPNKDLEYGSVYAYMLRAYGEDGTLLKTTFLYCEPQKPDVSKLDLKTEIDVGAGSITITNFPDIEIVKPTAVYLIYKEYDGKTPWKLVSDFDDVKATNKYDFNAQGQVWFSDLNFPNADSYGNNDRYYSVLIVVESEEFPEGSLWTIRDFYNHYE